MPGSSSLAPTGASIISALEEIYFGGRTAPSSPLTDHVFSPSPAKDPFAAYSRPTDVFFFASPHEAGYPENLRDISVKGGTYIGIAGGMEHNFSYWVASRPERIVLYDVNPWAIKLAQAKCELLPTCESYEQFIEKFDEVFQGRCTFSFTSLSQSDLEDLVAAGINIARGAASLYPQSITNNGWDRPEEFKTLKEIVASGRVEYRLGNILDHDLSGLENIGLVFLSDIFGINANYIRKHEFVEGLRSLLSHGNLRSDAQIIDAGGKPNVLSIEEVI